MAEAVAIWAYVAPKVTETHEMVDELHRVHGLRLTAPLQVSQTQRTTNTVAQTITEAGGTVTVERQ
jgi:hypothetical protein